MAELKERINTELENIDAVLNELPSKENLSGLSTLELAGTAALLHNFYTGIENVIKQILIDKRSQIPVGESWHKELLELATREKIISQRSQLNLREYLAFRHFFAHAYALDVYPERLELLVENANDVYAAFKDEIKIFM